MLQKFVQLSSLQSIIRHRNLQKTKIVSICAKNCASEAAILKNSVTCRPPKRLTPQNSIQVVETKTRWSQTAAALVNCLSVFTFSRAEVHINLI